MRGGSPLGGHFLVLLLPQLQTRTRLYSPSAWGRTDALPEVLGQTSLLRSTGISVLGAPTPDTTRETKEQHLGTMCDTV